MLTFNELKITPDNHLIVEVSVLDNALDPYRLAGIDHIEIGAGSDTQLTDCISSIDSNYSIYNYKYTFDISSGTPVVGDKYTDVTNTYSFTVLEVSNSQMVCVNNNSIVTPLTASGILTKTSGSGSASVVYSDMSTKSILRHCVLDLNLTDPTIQMMFGNDAINKLFYVKVTLDVTDIEIVDPTFCPSQVITELIGYAYNRCLLLAKIFDYIKSTNISCNNLDDYANYILQTQGLELAVESNNFTLANNYWNTFFGNLPTHNTTIFNNFNTRCRCCH